MGFVTAGNVNGNVNGKTEELQRYQKYFYGKLVHGAFALVFKGSKNVRSKPHNLGLDLYIWIAICIKIFYGVYFQWHRK